MPIEPLKTVIVFLRRILSSKSGTIESTDTSRTGTYTCQCRPGLSPTLSRSASGTATNNAVRTICRTKIPTSSRISCESSKSVFSFPRAGC